MNEMDVYCGVPKRTHGLASSAFSIDQSSLDNPRTASLGRAKAPGASEFPSSRPLASADTIHLRIAWHSSLCSFQSLLWQTYRNENILYERWNDVTSTERMMTHNTIVPDDFADATPFEGTRHRFSTAVWAEWW